MKVQNRVIYYLVMLTIYWFATSFLISLDSALRINKVFITLGFGFTFINIIYSFSILKWTILLNVLFSIVIASLSLFFALKFGDLHIFSKYDAYDILTSIICNALFSIVFWEIVFQVKTKMNINQKDE
ncbi:hypothetical protein [Flavobacterium piscis]|uniref:Phage holin family protein n=1 Tax=Flavobacterium piscis TaxID=1114874 RepID=A0ABU1Y7B1_9FLAO|nr:hypothetical protein [Flavobacterium piscis]MDR7210127.1 hypothetical protein [Flavobacterium piscis]